MTVSRREVERMLASSRRETLNAVELALKALEAELRDDLHTELVAITRRIDAVHAKALRALTRNIERRPSP